jgi:hypothetical protein
MYPKQVLRDGEIIHFGNWRRYSPERVPALWRRIADLTTADWSAALAGYGPLRFADTYEEPELRHPWRRTIERLGEFAELWSEADGGVWQLRAFPPAAAVQRLQFQLARVGDNGDVRLAVHGLRLAPEPVTLDAYLWLSAAESLDKKHKFKRCRRCGGWFGMRRHDAQFCGAVCRNQRPAPALEVA